MLTGYFIYINKHSKALGSADNKHGCLRNLLKALKQMAQARILAGLSACKTCKTNNP